MVAMVSSNWPNSLHTIYLRHSLSRRGNLARETTIFGHFRRWAWQTWPVETKTAVEVEERLAALYCW
jgi:hypothetical protein